MFSLQLQKTTQVNALSSLSLKMHSLSQSIACACIINRGHGWDDWKTAEIPWSLQAGV